MRCRRACNCASHPCRLLRCCRGSLRPGIQQQQHFLLAVYRETWRCSNADTVLVAHKKCWCVPGIVDTSTECTLIVSLDRLIHCLGNNRRHPGAQLIHMLANGSSCAGGDRAAAAATCNRSLAVCSRCSHWSIAGCAVLRRVETLQPLETPLEATVVSGDCLRALFVEVKDGRHPVRMVREVVARPSFDEVEAANAIGFSRRPVWPFQRANPQLASLEVPLRELVEADAVAFLGARFAADNAARCHHVEPRECCGYI